VLLVTDPGIPAIAERVAAILAAAGHRVEVFADLRSDPLAAQVDAAAERARAGAAACVVGLGGGSALDVAKLAAAIAPADRPAGLYRLAQNPLPKRPLAKVCVPTTAGTGSETTRVAVFTVADGAKLWAWGDGLRADLAPPIRLTGAAGVLTWPPASTPGARHRGLRSGAQSVQRRDQPERSDRAAAPAQSRREKP
jgi:alcohol dehydrogenase class IV